MLCNTTPYFSSISFPNALDSKQQTIEMSQANIMKLKRDVFEYFNGNELCVVLAEKLVVYTRKMIIGIFTCLPEVNRR